MSSLLQNKQIAHIATEVVVLLCVTFYFSSKNKKLLEHIEDLSQRLEDQEDSIQKHDQIIKQLVQLVNNRQPYQPPQTEPLRQQVSGSSQSPKSIRKKPNQINTDKQKNKIKSPPKIYEENEEIDDEADIQQYEVEDKLELLSDDESALDAELAQELEELDNEDVNNSLKKQ